MAMLNFGACVYSIKKSLELELGHGSLSDSPWNLSSLAT